MELSEKIITLRNKNNLSQEKLAKKLHVSLQTISKWESGKSRPTIDNFLDISKLFHLTTDELIDNARKINPLKNKIDLKHDKPKYFGTDGFRGNANVTLTVNHAFKIGRFLGWYYHLQKKDHEQPRILIGKDTRKSSYMYEYAIAAGVSASGANASIMHVTTSPSISYIVKLDKFDCGVMITASHNPYYDNGIKIINGKGEKLDDRVALLIEAYIDNNLAALGIKENDLPLATKENVGTVTDYFSGRNRYIAHLISLAKHSMQPLRIGLDTANGCSYIIARSVFEALGAKVTVINDRPNGMNVNLNAGSTHIEGLCKLVKEKNLDMGFAFDGDADRCLAVDENGEVIDGDKIIYLLALKLKREKSLPHNTVVSTIMSNTALTKALKKEGIKNVQTNVGDRFVFEKMQMGGFMLGGEQSGHIIIRKYATTGDGILTAIMITEEAVQRKLPLSELVKNITLFPQQTLSVHVNDQLAVLDDIEVKKEFERINKLIGENGRLLLRKSGTEPVIRIMAESPSIKECNTYIEMIHKVIKKRGHTNE